MSIKYSIIYPYYSRPELRHTLSFMFQLYHLRNDIEIVIVEDSKNFNDKVLHDELVSIITGWDNFHIRHILDPRESYNSASKYNRGVEVASGEIIILSNPEVVHCGDVLGYLDIHMMPGLYPVFDCASVILKTEKTGNMLLDFVQWYQHKTIPRDYHFLSAITREDYKTVGGFDERLCGGLAFEDDFWIKAVRKSLTVLRVEDPVCAHIEHPRSYSLTPEDKQRLFDINRKLWEDEQSNP